MSLRFLVVDEDIGVHRTFASVYCKETGQDLNRDTLLQRFSSQGEIDLDAVRTAKDAQDSCQRALVTGRPYDVVFIDAGLIADARFQARRKPWGDAFLVMLHHTPDEIALPLHFDARHGWLRKPLSRREMLQLLEQRAHTGPSVPQQSRFNAQPETIPRFAGEETDTLRGLLHMSHEIRNNLSGLLGLMELLSETNLDKAQKELSGLLHHNAEMLMILVNNALDTAKIHQGNMVLNPEPFDLHQTLATVSSLIEPAAWQKKTSLELRVDPSIPHLLVGDAVRLRQILLNLLGNAVKYTEQGSITVEAHIDGETEDMLALNIVVHDTGVGIDQEQARTLFQPFNQLDPSKKGTGLGLALSRKLAEMMGGSIWVNSEPGRGSSFFLSVNCKRPIAGEDGSQGEVNPSALKALTPEGGTGDEAQESSVRNQPIHIILAEDNPTNAKVVMSHLTTAGYQVTHYTSGLHVLKHLEDQSCDLILMDIQMPGLDGFDTTLKIREFDQDLPIIALTANVFRRYRERCLAVGMNDFLAKPIRKKSFLEMLTRWVGVPHGDDQKQSQKASDKSESNPHLNVDQKKPPIDFSRVFSEFEGDQGFVDRLLSEFYNLLQKRVGQMMVFLTEGELERLSHQLHQLKGGAANLCADELSDLARDAERALEANDRVELAHAMADLVLCAGSLREYLRHHWRTRTSSLGGVHEP